MTDPVLKKVKKYIEERNWPNHTTKELKPYLQRRDELSLEKGVILWGHRLVIPAKLREKILAGLHTSHFEYPGQKHWQDPWYIGQI
ncbi:hypothetical protein NQ317_000787 [Molorchus minor]|uniref:Uncharacterized protein n=1 Tax=Molorchus minor TaxID=1323400 RepID=A0ABQ9J5D8_9CUCU|nr:hypothetical protein NQ317_000787 [Molorchus minor]